MDIRPQAIQFRPFQWLNPSSSHSLYFLNLSPRPHYLKSYGTLKFRVFCSRQGIQLDSCSQHQASPRKEKRKPRPSFLQQIQDKWSRKTTSPREILPWQEEKQETAGPIEEFEEQRLQLYEADSCGTHGEGCVSVSSVPVNNAFRAPWVHGNEPSKEQPVVEAIDESEQKGDGENRDLGGFSGNFRNDSVLRWGIRDSDDVVIEGDLNGCKRGDSIPPELPEKEEILVSETSKDAPSTTDLFAIPTFSGSINDSVTVELDREIDTHGKRFKSNTELAEKLIPELELKRLRFVALRMVERIKVGSAGITQALVDTIHEKWKDEEVVKLKFEGPSSKNMKRTHEIIEKRTGGMVIWRSGSSLVLYRGMAYKFDCVRSYSKQTPDPVKKLDSSLNLVTDVPKEIKMKSSTRASESFGSPSSTCSEDMSEEEMELDLLLDELGPRFYDWSGREPLPVDADLLPGHVPGYQTPLRRLPYGIRPTLHNEEMTELRRNARTLPPHFALGRNRELQGLAAAIVKLWNRSAIAKIAIKRGVQNTSNERMAEELKVLTGGTLLSRNKEFIVFYRGNDFLPEAVTDALVEAQKLAALQQEEEEKARQKSATLISSNKRAAIQPLVAGTLTETLAACSRWESQLSDADREKMMRDLAVSRHASLVKGLERQLAIAKGKFRKAENSVRKMQRSLEPSDLPTDLETLTDEERFLFRKIGLSMKPYLVLGRREVFDGTVENMHLHWKYRELVKILVERKTYSQVQHIAISLEAESGGVLVSVDKTLKGYLIIIYRGKNYQRPIACRPKNLLTRRQALARSIELQRRESLKHHILELEGKIEKLKTELEDTKECE